LIRTSPFAGVGTGRSPRRKTSGPPGEAISTTFMPAGSAAIVARSPLRQGAGGGDLGRCRGLVMVQYRRGVQTPASHEIRAGTGRIRVEPRNGAKSSNVAAAILLRILIKIPATTAHSFLAGKDQIW